MLLLTLVPWPGPLEPRPACTREKAALVRKLVNKVSVGKLKKMLVSSSQLSPFPNNMTSLPLLSHCQKEGRGGRVRTRAKRKKEHVWKLVKGLWVSGRSRKGGQGERQGYKYSALLG